jgi:ubiquinone/menaquinone biosynthesis C-methylase UbiE
MNVCLECTHEIINDKWLCKNCGWQPGMFDNYTSFAPALALDNQLFDPANFDFLAKLESKHFWFRVRNKLINWAIKKHFPQSKDFLEIGCGTGYVLSNIQENFPTLKIHGSDIYVNSLPYAQNRLTADTKLFQMDARRMPFIKQFDLIGAFDVLEHIPEDTEVIDQIYTSLKAGGGFIVTVPQHPWLWSSTDDDACHVRRYKAKELQLKLVNAGFKVKMTSSFVCLLFPLMLITRILRKNNSSLKNELVINKHLNFLLEKILNIELLLIKYGVRFPFGGTRFIIASKK